MSKICPCCGNVIQPWAHGVCYNCVRIAREQHKYGRRRPPRGYQGGKQKQPAKPSSQKRRDAKRPENRKRETRQEARSKTKDLKREQAREKPPPALLPEVVGSEEISQDLLQGLRRWQWIWLKDRAAKEAVNRVLMGLGFQGRYSRNGYFTTWGNGTVILRVYHKIAGHDKYDRAVERLV